MSGESASSRASQIARQLLLFGRPIAKEELMERLSALTVERLTDLSSRLFSTTPTIAAVGPVGTLAPYEAIRDALPRSESEPAPTRGLITAAYHVRASVLPPRSSGAEGRARDAQDAGFKRLPRMGDTSQRKPRFPRALGAGLGARRAGRNRPGASGLRRYREDFARGTAIAFFIFETKSGKLLGGITLGNIRHGVAQTGHIGYWIGEKYAGRAAWWTRSNCLPACLRYDEVAPDRGCLYSRTTRGRSVCLKKPDFSAKDFCDPISRSTESGRITISTR